MLKTEKKRVPWPRGYKTFFMLNLAEHEIFHAYKSQLTIANSFLLNIVEHETSGPSLRNCTNCPCLEDI